MGSAAASHHAGQGGVTRLIGPPETIVVHGAVDTLIPPARGRKLAEALGARFILRDGFGHDGLFDSPAFDEFLADVLGSR